MHKVKGKMFSVVKCKKCGLLVTSPVINSPEDFEKYYPEHYYSYNPPSRKTIVDRLALFFYNLFYNPEQKMNPLRYLFFPLSYFVRGTKVIPGKKILDIGCGGGYFLQRMKDLGMKPYGIELGSRGVNECKRRGIHMWDIQVQKAPIENNLFDVITISAVLEHVVDVKATLKASHRVLKKGGTIVVMVPNAEGYSAKHYKEYWSEWDIPRHLTHFTQQTLRRYLEETGFSVRKIKYVGSSFQFTQSLMYKYPKMEKILKHPLIETLFNISVILTNVFGMPGRLEAYATKK